MCTDQARFDLYRLLQEDDTLGEPLLLDADRAEDGIGHGPCLGIGERQMRLAIGIGEAALLHEGGRTLKCGAAVFESRAF